VRFVERCGEDGEEDAARVAGDEVEATLLLDELEARRHGRGRVAIRSIHRSGEEINGDLEGGDENLDMYQIGTEACERQANPGGVGVEAENAARMAKRGYGAGAGAEEGVED